MQSIIVFTFLICITSAFNLHEQIIPQRKRFISQLEKESLTGRITHGQTAAANQFPYQVGLSLFDGNKYYWCGGSLISNEWVLTAAHCFLSSKNVTVFLGSITRLHPVNHVSVNESNIIIHEKFDVNVAANDIALIKIPPVNCTYTIQPIALPQLSSSNDTLVGETAVASGWGYTSDKKKTLSSVLHYADLQIISNTDCAVYFGESIMNEAQMCTSTLNSVATCIGDSGGPLVLKSSNVLIGIISFGDPFGCESEVPDAFIRVSYYLNWIQNNTGLVNK